MMPMVALYARVSTQRQAQEATIESQVAKLLDYAHTHHYEIPQGRHYLDPGVSGKRLVRPGLDRLRDAVAAGEISILLCLSPDRLARSLAVQQVVLDELRCAQVSVVFVEHPQADETPESHLLLQIQGAFAEYERVQLSDRMRRGYLFRLRQGQSLPHHAPYGYQYHARTADCNARWEIDPAAASVVQQIFAWYADLDWTMSAITQALNTQQIPSPGGKLWRRTAVQRILRHSAYRGETYWLRHAYPEETLGLPRKVGRGHLQHPRPVLRPVDEWITVPVPSIVESALWQRAQERIAVNTRFALRNTHNPYLLRGLLVCAVCRHTLQGQTNKRRVTYRCTHGGKHHPPDVPQHTCTIRADCVESRIWTLLTELLHEPHQIEDAWRALQEELAPTPIQTQMWHTRQQTLQAQSERLVDAYQRGAITVDELVSRRNPLLQELQTLTTRLSRVQPQAPMSLDLETFTQRLNNALQVADFDAQQEVIRLLIEHIVVSDEALTVVHIIPTVTNVRLSYVNRQSWRIAIHDSLFTIHSDKNGSYL